MTKTTFAKQIINRLIEEDIFIIEVIDELNESDLKIAIQDPKNK